MTALQEMLTLFPEYWDTDARSVPVLHIEWKGGGACWARIENDCMELVPEDPAKPRHRFELDSIITDPLTRMPFMMRFDNLIQQINEDHDYVATVYEDSYKFYSDNSQYPADYANVWRTYPMIYLDQPLPALPDGSPRGTADYEIVDGRKVYTTVGWYLDGPLGRRPLMIPGYAVGMLGISPTILMNAYQDIGNNPEFHGFTNLLWALLKPLARTLERAREYGTEASRQIDMRSALGPWLDRWGENYRVERIHGEDDNAFRRRLVATTFKPRLSGSSMEKALIDGLGMRDVTVDTLAHDVLSGDTPEYLPQYTFRVRVEADIEYAKYFGQTIKDIIDLYRAAGTTFVQQAHVRPRPEVVVKPSQMVRMSQFFTDAMALDTWFASDVTPWSRILHGTAIPGGTTVWDYGDQMFGAGEFAGTLLQDIGPSGIASGAGFGDLTIPTPEEP